MKITLGALITSLSLITAAHAGPFGIDMGSDPSLYDLAEDGPKPTLNAAPNPHPIFKEYAVWFSKPTGVCRIIAASDSYENDAYGEDVRQFFARVEKALETKYGDAEEIKFLKSDALWNEQSEWVMAIRQNERVFASVWEDASSEDGEEFSLIQLWVKANSSDNSFIALEYRSLDFDECEASINREQDSAF